MNMDHLVNQLVPMVIEQTGRSERAFDIYSRLLKERIVFLGTPIDDTISSLIIAACSNSRFSADSLIFFLRTFKCFLRLCPNSMFRLLFA